MLCCTLFLVMVYTFFNPFDLKSFGQLSTYKVFVLGSKLIIVAVYIVCICSKILKFVLKLG